MTCVQGHVLQELSRNMAWVCIMHLMHLEIGQGFEIDKVARVFTFCRGLGSLPPERSMPPELLPELPPGLPAAS